MMVRSLFALLITGLITSCVSHEELINFNQEELPYNVAQAISNDLSIVVESDDLLRITVSSIDPEAAAPFNMEAGMTSGMGQMNAQTLELFRGYLVDREGNIDFPLLGVLKVEGKTLEDVKRMVQDQLGKYLRDPVVTARYLNFKVTVLGEVNAPGIVKLTNSRVSVLDALGYAGDLTDYADRNQVIVIREDQKERSYNRLDLQRNDIFESPFFYLKQNDVVYVRPIRARTATVADPGQRLVSYGSALISVVTLIIAITR